MEPWRAEVSVEVDTFPAETWQVTGARPVTLGRDPACGLHVDHQWVSRQQARLHPRAPGWLLHNGQRARVRVTSEWVDAWFAPGAQVYLQPGTWTLAWDLDLRLALRVRPAGRREWPTAQDGDGEVPARALPTTAGVADDLVLTPLQRARLGALFAYLIQGSTKPTNLAAAAAQLLGGTPRAVLRTSLEVRDRLNRHRWQELETLEDLGHYLVTTTRTLTAADLPASNDHGGTRVPPSLRRNA